MLSIVPPTTFTASARVSVPGSATDAELHITWRHKTVRQFAAWQGSAHKAASDAEFLAEVIASWAGVGDADGKPLPYSPQALAQLLDAYPASGQELVQAYRAALVEARAKN